MVGSVNNTGAEVLPKLTSVSFTTTPSAYNLTTYFPALLALSVTVKVLLVPANAEGTEVYSVATAIVDFISLIVKTESAFLIEP